MHALPFFTLSQKPFYRVVFHVELIKVNEEHHVQINQKELYGSFFLFCLYLNNCIWLCIRKALSSLLYRLKQFLKPSHE